MKCKIDGKDYQNGTNLLKVHNGNSFANLHVRLKLELLQILLSYNCSKVYGCYNSFESRGP